MAEAVVNGVRLHYEVAGDGPPAVLVHGSWMDGDAWQRVVPLLHRSFRVLTYDRRGHSRSERPNAQGTVREDVDDLAGLIQKLGLAPAHVVAHSSGSNVALRLLAQRPSMFRSLCCHEPALPMVLADDPAAQPVLKGMGARIAAVAELIAAGDHERGARRFVEELAFGPGAWDRELAPEVRAVFVRNAPTFLDEVRDPDTSGLDLEAVAASGVPVCVTEGTESPPLFRAIIDRLQELVPRIERTTLDGAGHAAPLSHPEALARAVEGCAGRAEAAAPGT